MAPRLKVFVTSDGLTDFVVATSSKAKALAAWGSHQDLFQTGLAHQTDDADLVAAALAQPGEVLRRPAGSRAALARMKVAAKPKAEWPSKATLKKIADLEARLEALEAAHAATRADLADQRAEIDRRLEAAEADYAGRKARLDEALRAARQAPGSPRRDSGRTPGAGRARR